jgi:DNA-binding SARP family transcriptional activator
VSSNRVEVQLLGGFELRRDGEPLPAIDSARVASLIAYLVLNRDTQHSRQHLAYLLWPDSTDAQARTNLRHLLHKIRRSPEINDLIQVTPRTVGWRLNRAVRLDVGKFESALDRAADLDDASRLTMLTQAVDTYPGDLLPGCYDDWLLAERERLRNRFLDALHDLGVLHHRQGDHATAAGYLERLVREDPLRESAYQHLMLAYQARGDRSQAIRSYHICVSTLERELGVGPSPVIHETYRELLPELRDRGPHRPVRTAEPALVGRMTERGRLTAAWRAAESGQARFVLLTGEPGIGKTRLAENFAAWCARRGVMTAQATAPAAEGMLSYAPVVSWLRSPAVRRDRIGRGHLRELVRLLPELLNDHPDLQPPELMPEKEQRRRLFDAVHHALVSPDSGVVLVADNLQWFDRESLRLLHYLLRPDQAARLLVVATARLDQIDRDHPVHAVLDALRAAGQITELELSPLPREEVAALAHDITGRLPSSAEADRLFAETEGNPLFIVEALRAGQLAKLSPRVQAVIGSRLATLSPVARDLLGVAATIGREFSANVLRVASGAEEDELVAGLDELWQRRVIREQGMDSYDFVHEKVREVAYRAIPPARRRRHHRCVAEALSGGSYAAAGQVAYHYQRAGAIAASVPWAVRAADAAGRLHANTEAVAVLNRAVELVRTMPESAARDALELDLLTALPGPLCAVTGYSAPEVFAVQERAVELAGRLAVDLEPPLVRSLAVTSLTRGDFDRAREFGQQLLHRGERQHDDVLVVEAAYVLGIAAFWLAHFEAAREHFELAARRYRPEHRPIHLLRYGQDPLVVCTSRLANTWWFLGQPAEAVKARDTALRLGEEAGHPYSRAVALTFAAVLALDMDDVPQLRIFVAELATLGHQVRQTRVGLEALGGYLDVIDGRVAQGLDRCRRAIADQKQVESAPGTRAFLQRVLLAAARAAGDETTAQSAADRLLKMGGAASVWRTEALLANGRRFPRRGTLAERWDAHSGAG